MTINILMPALSPTMTEGKLAAWHKKEGDAVESGDVLAEIETDKATMEVEAVDEGTLGKILIKEGTDGVAVNTPIAILLEEGEDESALAEAEEKAKAAPAAAAQAAPEAPKPEAKTGEPAPTPEAKPAPAAAPPAPQASTEGGRLFASPLARRLAEQAGLDLSSVPGTGPHGRIVKRDVEAVKSGAVQPTAAAVAATGPQIVPAGIDKGLLSLLPDYEAVENSGMRKVIAKRLTESSQQVPHFFLSVDCNLDNLLAARADLNGRKDADYKLSVNDFLIKAASVALRQVPEVNCSYTDEAVLYFKRVDMAVAVAVEGGLITPIIHDAANLGLKDISAKAKELAAKARDGKLAPEEYQGGTFSISNLGMFGISNFTSIINQPQGAILSIGAGEQKPVVKNGELAIGTVMTATLAIDHRCIDGATGAKWMQAFKAIVEQPVSMLL
jgi:pyruvate dehydrogenase E2 component (dihydrolipoamide acetyltransferase)